jgi:hypothetical protein
VAARPGPTRDAVVADLGWTIISVKNDWATVFADLDP